MDIFTEVCGKAIKEQDMLGMYAAAITWQCQSAAPVANIFSDRRALRSYQKSLETNNITCLLCFVCARKYPYVRSSAIKKWAGCSPLTPETKRSLASRWQRWRNFRERNRIRATRDDCRVRSLGLPGRLRSCVGKVTVVCCPEDDLPETVSAGKFMFAMLGLKPASRLQRP